MPNLLLWTLVVFSVVTILGGLAVSRQQREAGLMAALVGLVTGLFMLGFAAGQFV